MEVEAGKTIEFNWFNTQNGQIKPIKFAVGDPREVTVPAGTFEVFPVEQSGGQPGNTIYLTDAKPRRIVRFDVTGTSCSYSCCPWTSAVVCNIWYL